MPRPRARWRERVLLGMVLAIAAAGLVYELAMAAVASYVEGDSVTEFSIVIGVYLSALGLGAYLSRHVDRNLLLTFVDVEIATALLGGLSAPGLFLAFGLSASFRPVLLAVVAMVGTLVGIELPLLMRILERRLTFKELVARALTVDYAGALVGSLGFSLLLLPSVGLVRSSILCGLLNGTVALGCTWLLSDDPGERASLRRARLRIGAVLLVLSAAAVWAPKLVLTSESRLFGRILRSVDSPYQRILLVDRQGALELYLNGHLQFSSRDERRYHEALVHPVLASVEHPRHVLIAGGGDGLALREVLKWPRVEDVTLVDLDRNVTELARTDPAWVALNRRSMLDSRARIVNQDAFRWLATSTRQFDVILLDFPDPSTYGVGRLYTTALYHRARARLTSDGAIGIQATSPVVTKKSFWTIVHTVEASGLHARPYRVYLPSFGDWGFVVAKRHDFSTPHLPRSLQLHTLDSDIWADLFLMPADTLAGRTPINRLDNQSLVRTYLTEASRLD